MLSDCVAYDVTRSRDGARLLQVRSRTPNVVRCQQLRERMEKCLLHVSITRAAERHVPITFTARQLIAGWTRPSVWSRWEECSREADCRSKSCRAASRASCGIGRVDGEPGEKTKFPALVELAGRLWTQLPVSSPGLHYYIVFCPRHIASALHAQLGSPLARHFPPWTLLGHRAAELRASLSLFGDCV